MAIKNVELDSLEKVMALLSEQDYYASLDRYRGSYLYRGMSDASFKMRTSLSRNCKELQRTLEPIILKNFTKYAVIEDPSLEKSVWRQMIVGQHHGLPTRLLDWSHSPLIGLHFATSGKGSDRLGTTDCVVWRVDMKELVSLLPERYRTPLERKRTFIMTVDEFLEAVDSLEQYDADMGNSALAVIEPPSIDPRIINQYAFFSVIPMEMTDIEEFLDRMTNKTVRYVIKKELVWRIRDMLDQLNINERVIYPDLDGLSKWLARHYFVKGEQSARARSSMTMSDRKGIL